MSPSDKSQADQDFPPVIMQLMRRQSSLAAAHEKLQRHQLGQFNFSQEQQDRLAQYAVLYQQLKTTRNQTQSFLRNIVAPYCFFYGKGCDA
jgi:hypothetical protein